MSTRLLYHAFGLRGYRYVKSEYLGVEWCLPWSQNLKR